MSKKTLILVNTLTQVQNLSYANHVEFMVKVQKLYPEDKFIFYTPARMSIDNARRTAVEHALANKADYILMLDDDVLVSSEGYKKLRDADKDVIAGITYVRAWPFAQMVFKYVGDNLVMTELDVSLNTPVKVGAVGFSFCLIKTSVFESMTKPYFASVENVTEDVFFCLKIAQERPKTEIFAHPGVHTSHILSPEVVHPTNVARLRKFYASGRKLPKSCKVQK